MTETLKVMLHLTIVEEYADQAARDFHSRKQGERGVIPAMQAFTAHLPDFMFLEPIAGPLRLERIA